MAQWLKHWTHKIVACGVHGLVLVKSETLFPGQADDVLVQCKHISLFLKQHNIEKATFVLGLTVDTSSTII